MRSRTQPATDEILQVLAESKTVNFGVIGAAIERYRDLATVETEDQVRARRPSFQGGFSYGATRVAGEESRLESADVLRLVASKIRN